jgi:hypothetical protein
MPQIPNSVIPAEAGIHAGGSFLVEAWIPAFAGMTTEGSAPPETLGLPGLLARLLDFAANLQAGQPISDALVFFP